MSSIDAGSLALGAASPAKRADAQRNTARVLDAAKTVFAQSGVDAPMREIAARAGVGVGTIYRNYPHRSDLIIAVFRQEVDVTAADAQRLGSQHPPAVALRLWADSFAGFVATKHGFASALHSGDPAYAPLPAYFLGVLGPRVQEILDAGAAEGSIRNDVSAEMLIRALSRVVGTVSPIDEPGESERITGILLDGMMTDRRSGA